MDFKHHPKPQGRDKITAEDQALIAKFLKKKKITQCPPMTYTAEATGLDAWQEIRKKRVRALARAARFESARAKREGKK